ncbi:MAG: S-methyl-5-thioribose-1-phosphate isomerase [Nitrososphaerota archaeon]|nr:S-methyl-5-thioribose-1-phosphate isomerase [Nitrososphaerota archaeon]
MVDFQDLRTVRWDGESVILIDQTKLPNKLTYVRCKSIDRLADAIKRMVVRGAPAIGVAAAMGLALVAKNSDARTREELIDELNKAGEILRATRPTAINLSWAIKRILDKANSTLGSVNELKQVIIDEAQSMADEDIKTNRKIGYYGARLIDDGDVVLTHCSTGTFATVNYGTALGVIKAAREEGKCVKVITTETRPALQGARLNAFELKEHGFDVTLITDSMVGYVMSRGLVNKVIVGADRITKDGYVFNKIGTYQIAVLANKHRIPFYVAAPCSTFDLSRDWRDVEIEERGIDEVVMIKGRRIAPKGIKVLNPAFDITPPDLITALITDRGILKPPYEISIRNVFS